MRPSSPIRAANCPMAGIPKDWGEIHISKFPEHPKSASSKDDAMSIATLIRGAFSLLPPSLQGDLDHRTR